MKGKVFLSHVHEDGEFVDRVYRLLPFGMAYIYTNGFKNGEQLIRQMEENVGDSSLFVLFVSRASLNSCWVGFEIDRARIATIKSKVFRIMLFPADPDVQISELPAWMRDFWYDNRARNAHDVARAIRATSVSANFDGASKIKVFGRGQQLDVLEHQFALKRRELGGSKNANIILVAGLEGIGRQTFLYEALDRLYPTISTLRNGPTIELPIWAEIIDFYRALRELVEDKFDLKKFGDDRALFDSFSETEKIRELTNTLLHFSKLNEAVFFRVPSALFEKNGNLKHWVKLLFTELSNHPSLVLCFISNRQVPAENATELPLLFQTAIGGLAEEAITTLIDFVVTEIGLRPPTIDTSLLLHIGGHPMLARAYVRLVEQYGSKVFEKTPHKIYSIQEGILKDNLSHNSLTRVQKEIMHVLSWLPRLDGRLLENICAHSNQRDVLPFIDELNNLVLGCLVEVYGNTYQISGAVRSMFRRRFGFGPRELLEKLATELNKTLAEEDARGTLRADVIDAVIYIYALEGKTLPDAFKKLLLPSTLETLVRDAYNSGRENPASYRTAIRWGLVAENMIMDEATREEILSTVIRAYIREEEFVDADALLRKIEARGYRSKYFLRGFWFASDDAPEKAIPLLEQATKERRYRASAINQLGICYFRTGNWNKLNILVNGNNSAVERSAFLLDLKAQFLTGSGDYPNAEKTIEQLSRLPEDDDRSQKRRAMLLAKRDKNFDEAMSILSRLIESGKGRQLDLRFVRGILAAKAGKEVTAKNDSDFILAHGKKNAKDQSARIEMRLALKRGKWKSSEAIYLSMIKRGFADELTYAEILDLKSRDYELSMSDRHAAYSQSQSILVKHKNYSDLDFVES